MATRVETEVGRDWKGSFSALPSPRLTLCAYQGASSGMCPNHPPGRAATSKVQIHNSENQVAIGEFSIAGTSYNVS